MDLGPAGSGSGPLGETLAEVTWIEPIPDGRVLSDVADPAEVAELLETSVQSVNSALQRARATIEARRPSGDDHREPSDPEQRALVERYVQAFESYDMSALTSVLHEDAMWNMPPYELWLGTHEDIVAFCHGIGSACEGSRLVPVEPANGQPAFGQYKPGPEGELEPWSLQVLELSGDRLSAVTFFLDTERYFPLFGLPYHLDG